MRGAFFSPTDCTEDSHLCHCEARACMHRLLMTEAASCSQQMAELKWCNARVSIISCCLVSDSRIGLCRRLPCGFVRRVGGPPLSRHQSPRNHLRGPLGKQVLPTIFQLSGVYPFLPPFQTLSQRVRGGLDAFLMVPQDSRVLRIAASNHDGCTQYERACPSMGYVLLKQGPEMYMSHG